MTALQNFTTRGKATALKVRCALGCLSPVERLRAARPLPQRSGLWRCILCVRTLRL